MREPACPGAYLGEVLPSLPDLVGEAEDGRHNLLDEQLLHEGWVCHEPSHHPACGLQEATIPH